VALAKHWKTIIALSLVIFNVLIKKVVKFAVKQIGYKTKIAEMKIIMVATFLCQFFNTAFVLLLVTADMSEQPFPFMFPNSGMNGDFNSSFFNIIGDILVQTMIL
jgi:hypothetical protein